MLKVGLTGGIACGKSHVARRLAASGLQVVDLDAVAHGTFCSASVLPIDGRFL